MTHTVAPILYEALLEELVLLGCQRVLELTGVGELDFLIPAFGTYGAFALEGIDLRQRHREVGERHCKCRVLGTLRDVGGC